MESSVLPTLAGSTGVVFFFPVATERARLDAHRHRTSHCHHATVSPCWIRTPTRLHLPPSPHFPSPAPSLLSLPSIFACHGRSQADHRHRIAIAPSRPGRIEAHHRDCLTVMFLHAEGIGTACRESTPPSRSSPPPAAALLPLRRAPRHHLRPPPSFPSMPLHRG